VHLARKTFQIKIYDRCETRPLVDVLMYTYEFEHLRLFRENLGIKDTPFASEYKHL